MKEEEANKKVKELQEIFKYKFDSATIKWDKDEGDRGGFLLDVFTIEPTEDNKWYVLGWESVGGSYWEPPDVVEHELGTFDAWTDAIRSIWRAVADQELEARFIGLMEPEFT